MIRLCRVSPAPKKEEFATTTKNRVKQDTALKTFWRNNERFADLFNVALFNGEQMIKPEDLTEVDTDLSSIITINGHAETIQRIVDVAKKKAIGGIRTARRRTRHRTGHRIR